jgi:hypothetical protein
MKKQAKPNHDESARKSSKDGRKNHKKSPNGEQ